MEKHVTVFTTLYLGYSGVVSFPSLKSCSLECRVDDISKLYAWKFSVVEFQDINGLVAVNLDLVGRQLQLKLVF